MWTLILVLYSSPSIGHGGHTAIVPGYTNKSLCLSMAQDWVQGNKINGERSHAWCSPMSKLTLVYEQRENAENSAVIKK